jgi:Raf kinase inhibitor-like YbhB/YbcL family protein
MKLTSTAFAHGAAIPTRFTCEGQDISPELSWSEAPKEAACFALVLHDPDAPRAGGFTHWVIYDMPSHVNHLREGLPNEKSVSEIGSQGKNEAGRIGYMGPCPPSGKHRYIATLYALRTRTELPPGAPYQQVTAAIEDKVITTAELMGTYEKAGRQAA